MQCITIAWRVVEREAANITTRRADLGEPVRWRDVYRPRAVVWRYSDSPADVEAARAFAASQPESMTVRVYPGDEADPLGRAKRDVMR